MEKLRTPEEKNNFGEILDLASSTDLMVYERLNASNDKAAKNEFVNNPELVHPNNEYGNLSETEFSENLEKINAAKQMLENSDLSDKRKRLVNLILQDNENKNNFLKANYDYNNAGTPEEKAEAAARHREANEALYGKADEDTFYTLLNEKISSIDVGTLSPEDKAIYGQLIEKIGPLKEVPGRRFKPKQETVERFSELVHHFFDNFLRRIPEDKESFTSSEVVDIINEILGTEFGGLDVKYKAVIDPKASNASVNHENFLIKFPEEKEYSNKKAKSLIVHELGTHVMRAIPYLNTDIEVFAKGLPDNETFDEGIAKCVEQAINGKYEDSGIDHYINIGLATFKGKNFREVYDIQMMLKHLTGSKSDTVLNAVQRCFRGTGELVNNKDLAYFNGANQVWRYIEEHIDGPNLFDNLFLTGKANIGNPAQEALSYEMRMGGL